MKTIFNGLALLLAFSLFFSLWGFFFALRPIRMISPVTPKDFGIPYEDISIKTSDNILIRAWFIPSTNSKAKTIILLHGYPADKGNILPAMIFLHPYYNLLLFDFRYFGQSGGHYSTIGKDEVLDLEAVIKYLHSRKINEVGVWGFSLGGAVALRTAVNAPEIKAIVAESTYARLDWMAYEYYPIPLLRYPLGQLTRLWAWLFLRYDIKQVSPADAASKLKIPVLLIHSRSDNVISFKHALMLQEALKNNPNAQVHFVDKETHGEMITDHQRIIKSFFDEWL